MMDDMPRAPMIARLSSLVEIVQTTLHSRCSRSGTWYLAEQFPAIAAAISADAISALPDRAFRADIIDALDRRISGFELIAGCVPPFPLLPAPG